MKLLVPALIIIVLVGAAGYFGWQYISNNPGTKRIPVPTGAPQNITPGPNEIVLPESDKQILAELGLTCEPPEACRLDKLIGDYAKGTMTGGVWLAQKIDGKWKAVVTGNGIPHCSEVDAYSIPKDIFGNCIEASGELRF